MRLRIFLLLFSPVWSENNCSSPPKSSGNNNGNIYIPVIVCLCQALLLSIAVNVYYVCMTRSREQCQNIYTQCFAVWCQTGTANFNDQVQADETQNVALNNSTDIEESERPKEECVYSVVKCSKK